MKITKLVHSCLFVEGEKSNYLIDPGQYSWDDVDSIIEKVDNVDFVVITHGHPDHLGGDFIKAIVNKFPEVVFICNESIEEKINALGVDTKFTRENENVKSFEAPHGTLPFVGMTAPENNGYHIEGKLSTPGDSHIFSETQDVLAMPFIGPWGLTKDAVDLVLKLKPSKVLPIHDWHYSDAGREWLYSKLEDTFKESGIEFIDPRTGTFEV